jgi:Class III cytochrome C family.
MKKTWLAAIVIGLMFAVTATVLAGVPENKKTIIIDHLPGKKGAVTFEHAKHVDSHKKASDKAITCKDCHHTLKDDSPADAKSVKACTECHVMEGAPQKEYDGKKAPYLGNKNDKGDFVASNVLYHKTCQKCHKEMSKEGKKIDTCTTCHKK